MDIGIIVAIVGSAIAIVGTVISMMYWVRSESNSLRNEAKEDRKEFIQLVRDIQMESKDFHYRLLEIERGRK